MSIRPLLRSVLGCLLATVTATVSPAADWPEFRGPGQQGHSDEQGLPLHWSVDDHVVWKTEIPVLGWSSPAIAGGKIWLTTGVDDGHSLRALRLDATSGTIEKSIEVFTPAEPGSVHSKNSHASPLVVGDELYLVSDNGVISCLDARTGAVHWQERLGGDCTASPLHADGRIQITDENGVAKVIAPGKTFQELATNELPGRTLASLATADGAIFLRTDTATYRLDD